MEEAAREGDQEQREDPAGEHLDAHLAQEALALDVPPAVQRAVGPEDDRQHEGAGPRQAEGLGTGLREDQDRHAP